MATRLKRLKIVQFRDVQPGTELHFHPGWNVILGRNGTGKTTLLHLLSMVLRDDFTEISQEPFCLEYTLALPDAELSARVTNQTFPQLVSSRHNFARVQFTYSAKGMSEIQDLLRDDDMVAVKWGETPVLVPRGDVLQHGRLHLATSPEIMGESASKLRQSHGRQSQCFRLDEAVALFDTLVASARIPRPSVPNECFVKILGAPTQDSGHDPSRPRYGAAMVPDFVVASAARAFTPNRSVVEVDLTGDPLLERMVALLWFQRVALVAKRGQTDATNEATLGEFTLYGYRAVGPPLHHSRWSFGQQRLFAIFWSLACNPDVLIADELTNGLHWEWIQACVAAIADRQVFVAVQNPLLLEHVGFESPEDVARAFVLCSLGADAEGAAQTRWSQPEAAQAERFYRAWQRGIQPVHEVLMSEGLW